MSAPLARCLFADVNGGHNHMSTARRSRPNEFGFDEQGFTYASPGSSPSLIEGDLARSEREFKAPLFISDPRSRTSAEEYAGLDEDDCAPLKARSLAHRLLAACLAIATLGGSGAVFHAQIADIIVRSIPCVVSDKASAAPVETTIVAPSTLSTQDVIALAASQPGPPPLGDPIVRSRADAVLPPVPSGEATTVVPNTSLQDQPQPASSQAPATEIRSGQVHAPQVTAASPFSISAAAPQPAKDAVHWLAPDQIALLIRRGDNLLGSGDVAAARLVLRRAAEAGDARAMIKLGATYDPALLSRIDNHGVAPDLASARGWYEKAAQFGAPEAARRLEALARR